MPPALRTAILGVLYQSGPLTTRTLALRCGKASRAKNYAVMRACLSNAMRKWGRGWFLQSKQKGRRDLWSLTDLGREVAERDLFKEQK